MSIEIPSMSAYANSRTMLVPMNPVPPVTSTAILSA